MNAAAVLFAKVRSPYFHLAAVVYDERRDARTYDGVLPVVAHPPCAQWGRLREFAKKDRQARELALFAVATVRRVGGVLEHPASSDLWRAASLPKPGKPCDEFGGWTLGILQSDFGHRAPKPTWLYIVGCEPADLPAMPLQLGHAAGRVEFMGRSERERTPNLLCTWLLAVAERCGRHVA